MTLEEMRDQMEDARKNLILCGAAEQDSNLCMILDNLIDVMGGLIGRQLTTEEDRPTTGHFED